jgi:hypothetical protein
VRAVCMHMLLRCANGPEAGIRAVGLCLCPLQYNGVSPPSSPQTLELRGPPAILYAWEGGTSSLCLQVSEFTNMPRRNPYQTAPSNVTSTMPSTACCGGGRSSGCPPMLNS